MWFYSAMSTYLASHFAKGLLCPLLLPLPYMSLMTAYVTPQSLLFFPYMEGGVRKWISTIRRKLSPFPWIPDQCLSWGLGHVGCWPQLLCKGMASQFSSWSARRFLVCWTSEVHYPPDQPPHNVAFRDPTTPLCAEQSNFSRICLLQPSLYNFSCRGSYPAGGLYDSWCLNVCFECNLAFRLNAGKLSRRSSFLKGIFVSDEHPPFQMLPQQVFLDE